MPNPIDNSGDHLHRAIASTTCGKHNADVGMPCWTMANNTVPYPGALYYAICGKRIKKAGYNGKISPASMRMKPPVKPTDGERKPFKRKPTTRPAAFSGAK